MIAVPDAASIATMHWLNNTLGIKAGPSTGTNLWGALSIAEQMKQRERNGIDRNAYVRQRRAV